VLDLGVQGGKVEGVEVDVAAFLAVDVRVEFLSERGDLGGVFYNPRARSCYSGGLVEVDPGLFYKPSSNHQVNCQVSAMGSQSDPIFDHLNEVICCF
jgi:hypothetical protein